MSQLDRLTAENNRLREALIPIVEMLSVGYNSNLVHLEIYGVPAFRPIESPMRDNLGTLFTLLFNARVVLGLQNEKSS